MQLDLDRNPTLPGTLVAAFVGAEDWASREIRPGADQGSL